MIRTKLLLLCCFVLLNSALVFGRIDGWIQTNANTGRSRNSDLGTYDLQRDVIKMYDGLKLIPNSIVMPVYALNFCGLSVDQASGGQVIVCIERDGGMSSSKVKIPKEYELMDVLPVMDENFGYYTVRRNTTNGVSFVLRSSILSNDQNSQVLFDTKTNNNIHAMVLTDYGLIIASGNFIVNVDRKSGIGNWIINLSGIQSGCQFLYDLSQSVPTLYILYSSGITAIHPQTGATLLATPSNFYINFAPQHAFLTVGKDFLAIPDKSYGNSVSIVEKRNLQRGIIATVKLVGKNGIYFQLDKCSNLISRDTNSFFLSCMNADSSLSALRFDVTNTTVTLGYEINANSLFGIPPKVCSSQIAAYGKTAFYGMACDVGLIGFHQDNILVPRREIHIDVAHDTQVYGTLGRFALITSNNGKTQIEFVYIQ
ncbi:predicted protein [Naegleria gruberi]|uniref:Predicted protein n=1 Tax=Naegleria gruberi TaxID=5762 RepID=D2VGZ9_NAEGR|nr:uncharacterized protein NAEGRDRAFT_68226 [Naegleria gruberi]EFC43895.1 predicted protein [Naegleria gruberi]|eukprot:XP_002676639.1 predicted protein [Naegleria gruberi strain NEG-M]